MIGRVERDVFEKGSTTYYWSSRFFPRKIRNDVFKLYSFVRVADNYVDIIPVHKPKFYALRKAWAAAIDDPSFTTKPKRGESLDARVVKNMVAMSRKYSFDRAWTEAFLDAMQSDLEGKTYRTMDDTLAYMYGSAEVIGLMMCKIMHVNPAGYEAARLQGRAMQYINFIRDMAEDIQLGRCYFPQTELAKYNLADINHETASAHPVAFQKFMHAQIEQYSAWQSAAEAGYTYLPKRLLIPVKTAAHMYDWTAQQIDQDSMVVYRKKIKPGIIHVLLTGLRSIA
jgi:phytoene synthase